MDKFGTVLLPRQVSIGRRRHVGQCLLAFPDNAHSYYSRQIKSIEELTNVWVCFTQPYARRVNCLVEMESLLRAVHAAH